MKKFLKDKVREKILQYIEERRLQPGDRLISEKSFAQLFKVNHLTVRTALSMLVETGFIEKRPRSGAYVKRVPTVQADTRPQGSNLVAVLMDPRGHYFSNLYTTLSRQLEADDFIPLNFSFSALEEAGDAAKIMDQVRSLNCRKLITLQDTLLFTEKISSQLNLRKGQPPYWENIVWVHGDTIPGKMDYYGDFIVTSSRAIVETSLAHLFDQGHRRIALMTNSWDPADPFYDYYTTIIRDYCSYMTELGIPEEIRIIRSDLDENVIIEGVKRILSQPAPPTALVSTIDYRAVCALKAVIGLGLSVPDDIAIVGNIDTPWASEFDMSSVDHNIPAIAQKTVQQLTTEKSDPARNEIVYLAPELVIRGSSSKKHGLKSAEILLKE